MRPFLLTLVLAASAMAQPATPHEPREPVSPTAAVGLALGVPIAAVSLGMAAGEDSGLGAALIIGGMFVGPSAGNLARGHTRDALIGTGLRLAGATALGGAFVRSLEIDRVDALSTGLAIAGAGALAAGTGYDLLTSARPAPRRVDVAPAGAGLAVRIDL